MAIVAECPICGKRFKADESQAGKKAKCSQCANVFVIGGTAKPATAAATGTAAVANNSNTPAPTPAAPKPLPGALPAPVKHGGARTGAVAASTGNGPKRVAPPGAKSPATTPSGGTPAHAARAAAPAVVASPRTPAATSPASTPTGSGPAPAVTPAPAKTVPNTVGGETQDLSFDLTIPDAVAMAGVESATATPPSTSAAVAVEAAAERAAASTLAVAELDAHRSVGTKSDAAAAPQAPTERKGLKWLAIALTLLVVAGSAAVLVPRLLNPSPGGPAPADKTGQHPVVLVMDTQLPPSSPAWSIQPDTPNEPLRLPEKFRLVIPSQGSLHLSATSVVLAQQPSPCAAITAVPDNAAAPATAPASPHAGSGDTVLVWNLATQSKIGNFTLPRRLSAPALSRDGAYYAGQVSGGESADNKSTRVEVWSIARAQQVYALDIPTAMPLETGLVLGFPSDDQMLLAGDKLRQIDLPGRTVKREIALPPWSPDSRVVASSHFKLVAFADSKAIYLVDVVQGKLLGPAAIPEVVVSHPRKRLTLRAMDFSPDGTELALVFDNRISARRIAICDVATGKLKALHTPVGPVFSGGPELQWLTDGRGWMLGSGVLIDRDTSRQVGQVYADLAEEGLGGQLVSLVGGGDRALVAWDKHPRSLVLRAVPVQRERPGWVQVNIRSAQATAYRTLQCVGKEFGNVQSAGSPIVQTGRLTDNSVFLAVDVAFMAALSADAPELVTLRPDQFTLLADGQVRSPIGTLTPGGILSLEMPEYDVRKGDGVERKRVIVFATTGSEKSLLLQVGSAQRVLNPAATATDGPAPRLSPPTQEQLPPGIFTMRDDTAAVLTRILSTRMGPLDYEPEAAGQMPLKITYASPESWLLTVRFEVSPAVARGYARSGRMEHPRIGLMLENGTHLRPAAELPGLLPALMDVGERYTHTALFVINTDPARARSFRLTWDNTPVATIKSELPSARLP